VIEEKRRHARRSIDLPVTFVLRKGGAETSGTGIGRDISIGGMFIETSAPGVSFGAEVKVRVSLRGATGSLDEFELPGVIRWVRSGGMGVQFGLLGAHETHAITELSRP
jgi:hypothetical protein